MGAEVVTATEAVRSFSEILNNIRYRGDRYTILRGGKPVAVMGPVEAQRTRRTLAELVPLVQELPGLDPEDTSFAKDVLSAAFRQPALPEVPPWE